MTGIYADIPGPRMAYDQDGSKVWFSSLGSAYSDITAGSAANLIKVDGSIGVTASTDGNGTGSATICIMFPEPRDFKGLSWGGVVYRAGFTDLVGAKVAQYSTDATLPSNGTWNNLGSSGAYWQPFTNANAVPAREHRASIYAQSVSAVTGIRITLTGNAFQGITFNFGFSGLQLFGVRAASDHLAFWHPTLDQALDPAAFDWSDVWVGKAAASRQFRLKNRSATLTANSPSVAYSDLAGIAFGASTVQLSTDNSTFVNTISSLSNIAAGAISPILYCKLNNVAARTAINPIAGRLVASATSWT